MSVFDGIGSGPLPHPAAHILTMPWVAGRGSGPEPIPSSEDMPYATAGPRPCGAVKSMTGPSGTMPVGLMVVWLA